METMEAAKRQTLLDEMRKLNEEDRTFFESAERVLQDLSWDAAKRATAAAYTQKALSRARYWNDEKKVKSRGGKPVENRTKKAMGNIGKAFLELADALQARLEPRATVSAHEASKPAAEESPAETGPSPAAGNTPPSHEDAAPTSDQAIADDTRASKLVSDTFPIEVWMTEDIEDARRLSHTADGLVRTDRIALFEKWKEAVELFDAVGATTTNPHLGAPPPAAPETSGEDAVNDNSIPQHVTPDNDTAAVESEADAQVPPALPTLRDGTPVFRPAEVPAAIEAAPLEADPEPEPIGPPALNATEQAEAIALLNANTREWTRPQFRRARQLVWAAATMASGDRGETIACIKVRPGAGALKDRLISEETWRREEMVKLANETATQFFQERVERQAAHLLGVNDPREFRPEADENGVNESLRLQERWMMEDLIAKRPWTEADFAWARANFDALRGTHPRGEQRLREKYRALDKPRQDATVNFPPRSAAPPSQTMQPFSPVQPHDANAQTASPPKAGTPKSTEPKPSPVHDSSKRVVRPLGWRTVMAIGGMALIAGVIAFVGIRYHQDTFRSPPSDTAAPTPPPAPVTPPPAVQRPTPTLPPPANALPPAARPQPPVVVARQPVLRPLRPSDLGDRHLNLERVPRYGRGAIPAQVRFRNVYCVDPPTSATDARGRETLDFSQCSWREFPSPDRSATSAPPNDTAPAAHGSKPERAPVRRGANPYLTV